MSTETKQQPAACANCTRPFFEHINVGAGRPQCPDEPIERKWGIGFIDRYVPSDDPEEVRQLREEEVLFHAQEAEVPHTRTAALIP